MWPYLTQGCQRHKNRQILHLSLSLSLSLSFSQYVNMLYLFVSFNALWKWTDNSIFLFSSKSLNWQIPTRQRAKGLRLTIFCKMICYVLYILTSTRCCTLQTEHWWKSAFWWILMQEWPKIWGKNEHTSASFPNTGWHKNAGLAA